MEPGHRRTIIARTAAGLGTLCGVNALLSAITNDFWIYCSSGRSATRTSPGSPSPCCGDSVNWSGSASGFSA